MLPLPHFQQFARQISHPIRYRLFLLSKLPLGLVCGLRVVALSPERAVAAVRYSWINKNPFRSVYFAPLSMAAELTTGLLAFGHVYQQTPKVSMLIAHCEGHFVKKATGTITFTSTDGQAIANAVATAIATQQPVVLVTTALGIDESLHTVATFSFTWSFKVKA
jgi:hypothetical protein